MDKATRIFSIDDFLCPTEGEPIRSVVLQTDDAAIVVWHVAPGQEIAAHVHPHGQDTWTVIAGRAEYYQGGGASAWLKVNRRREAWPSAWRKEWRHGTVYLRLGRGIGKCRLRPGRKITRL